MLEFPYLLNVGSHGTLKPDPEYSSRHKYPARKGPSDLRVQNAFNSAAFEAVFGQDKKRTTESQTPHFKSSVSQQAKKNCVCSINLIQKKKFLIDFQIKMMPCLFK